MAKCSICNTSKGKRKCKAVDSFVCSLCCGKTRNSEKCDGCSFYSGSEFIRDYNKVPYYPVPEMANDLALQDRSDVIESAICQFDFDLDQSLTDSTALRLIELLLDKYYYEDEVIKFKGKLEENGFLTINEKIQKDIDNRFLEDLSKILSAIYRSIKRHTKGGREYLKFIHQHVGIRIIKGIRGIQL